MVHLKIKKMHEGLEDPLYAHEGDAAFDLRSAEKVLVKAGEKAIVKTGLQMAIPLGYVGLIWDRSGLAAKNSIHTLAGVVDSGYRGEVGVVMKNLGNEDFQVEKNMRIAQMLIQPVATAKIELVSDLEDTKRGDGGFGSTGVH